MMDRDGRIRLPAAEYQRMVDHARTELPNEACGLLAGHADQAGKRIEKVYLLTNTDRSNQHFTLDPKEQLAAVRDMRSRGYIPLGNWHSHPETPARPSEEDKRLAYDSRASYLILSLADRDAPVLRAFHIEGDTATEEALVIETDG